MKIEFLFNNPLLAVELGEQAFLKLKEEFSEERHYSNLINLFNNTIESFSITKPLIPELSHGKQM
jgi:imidazoleglycerol phosphate synthase glutamine amidotransferase subunit HisH